MNRDKEVLGFHVEENMRNTVMIYGKENPSFKLTKNSYFPNKLLNGVVLRTKVLKLKWKSLLFETKVQKLIY